MQICFPDRVYDSTVKPYWNNTCKILSENLFLPALIRNKPNFTVSVISDIVQKILPVTKQIFPVQFKTFLYSKPDIVIPAVKKIRFYFTSSEQRIRYCQMMTVARRAYNLAVDLLNNGKYINNENGKSVDLRPSVREIVRRETTENNAVFDVNVCDQAVRLAQSDFIAVCRKNKNKKQDGTEFSSLGFKSRKNRKQTFSHPRMGKTGQVCSKSLGKIRLTEKLPEESAGKNVDVTCDHGRWFICVMKNIIVKGNTLSVSESQGYNQRISQQNDIKEVKCIALDPGSRTFMTGFNEREAVLYGKDFSVNYLLPLAKKMRQLFSLRQNIKNHTLYKKEPADRPKWMNDTLRHIEKQLDRLECKRQDLTEYLHKTVAYQLVSDYDVIYLPEFRSKEMVKTKGRNLNRKSVHNMLSLRHYRFKEFLLWLAKKYGKKVIIVNESYTSKTRSWNGIIDENLGSAKTIKEQDLVIDRDINGARSIYLKHVAFAMNQPVPVM